MQGYFPAASQPARKVPSVVQIGVRQDLESKPARFVFVASGNTRVLSQEHLCRSVRALKPERDRIAFENAARAGQ